MLVRMTRVASAVSIAVFVIVTRGEAGGFRGMGSDKVTQAVRQMTRRTASYLPPGPGCEEPGS